MLPLLFQKADTVVAKLVGPIIIQQPDTVYSISITPTTTVDPLAAYSTVAVALLALAAIGVEVWRDIRRSAEVRREQRERRTAIDARIRGIAYALRRQLQSWLDEAPSETNALLGVYDAWAAAVKELGGTKVGEVVGV